jgi:HPt (histidine-containing phosphotransfer) domain-containing protein
MRFRKGFAMKSVKPLDKTALVNLYNIGGKDFLLKMIDGFLLKAPERLQSARTNLGSGDVKSIHLIAHSLKASCANLGAVKVHEVAERLEEASILGLKDNISDILDKLEESLSEALQSLQSERGLWDLENPKV